jgi:hydroxyethylthiazole kinase-like uncharacterized protein yjeF
MKTVTAAEMMELDRHAIEDLKIPSLTLMENAGKAVAEAARSSSRPLVICGKGNNGGDGFVAARYLSEWGKDVTVILIGRVSDVKADPKVNIGLLKVPVIEVPDLTTFEKVKDKFAGADLIIDAIFGIGLNDLVKSPEADIITYITSLHKPVISVDVPSGVDATTGKVLRVAIRATQTITFAAMKRGLMNSDYAGEVKVVDIGIPVSING